MEFLREIFFPQSSFGLEINSCALSSYNLMGTLLFQVARRLIRCFLYWFVLYM